MKEKRDYSHSIKESRRTCKIPLRFLLHNEVEEINLDENTTAEYAGSFHEGVALNIDVCGLLIATNPDRIPKLGEKLTAIFELELVEKTKKVTVEADVVWANKYSPHYPKGFAVKFSDVSINAKDLREGIERSWKPEIKIINGANLLSVPD